jgi:hypothetical protein
MVPAAAALRRHYGGISRPCVVVTRDADHVGDPKDQSIRLAHPDDHLRGRTHETGSRPHHASGFPQDRKDSSTAYRIVG